MAFTPVNCFYENFKIAEANGISYEELYITLKNALFNNELNYTQIMDFSAYEEYLTDLIKDKAVRQAGYKLVISNGMPLYIKEDSCV